ncbi:C1QL4-like protein [Mya arenaria]|uniref:C1QL4-like protein n=1 Tax=Mya arenaria TaxID=6604 RepID=A0ABY7E0W8_MYAAR|nr:C1QL4-like protein [Mya arenaria]
MLEENKYDAETFFELRVEKVAKIEKLKAQQQELSDALQGLQRGQPRTAFTATMSADKSGIPNHTTIVFDVVITNKGGAYSPSNGIFTSKTAGVYVFSWVTTNKNRTWMNTELMLNGEKKGTAMSDSGDINDYSVAANTVSLELQVGDQVWVRAGTWHNGKLAGEWRTTFTGWQL